MYKIVSKVEDVMVVLVVAVFCCLIGQWTEWFWPDNLVPTMLFLLFACVGASCNLYRTIYNKGMKDARKESDEDTSAD